MTAGLPGTGIGGIFYLMCAISMPFFEIYQTIKGKSNIKRWKMVSKHFAYAVSIFAAFVLLGKLLELIINLTNSNLLKNSSTQQINLFSVQPIFFSLGTLVVVLVSMRILQLFLRLSKD